MTNWKKVPVEQLDALPLTVERIKAFQTMCEVDEYTDTTLAHELLADVAKLGEEIDSAAEDSK